MSLRYIWKAIYPDGESLEQFNEDGSENGYLKIDRSKLTHFVLSDSVTGKSKIILHLQPGQQLIHRRRVVQKYALSAAFFKRNPEAKMRETVYIVGWHENRDGVNVQMLLFVFEDGTVEIMDKWRNDHALYNPVILLPEEEL